MADTKKSWLHILKSEKWMSYEVIPFVSVDKKWFPLMNGILEMSWFVHIFLQN